MIVKRSFGAYTHDDVFFLNGIFVMGLLLMYFEQDTYQARFAYYKKELNKT